MTLKFYKYSGDPRVMGKQIGDAVLTLTGKHKENTSMFLPTFIVNTNSMFKDVNKPNYLYADDFGKYYFVRDIQANTDGTCDITCEEDVLTTFKEQLKEIKFIIERSNGASVNDNISDTSIPMEVVPHVRVLPFKGENVGFSNELSFILHCAGPSGTES